jgi:hypothetical protein
LYACILIAVSIGVSLFDGTTATCTQSEPHLETKVKVIYRELGGGSVNHDRIQINVRVKVLNSSEHVLPVPRENICDAIVPT